MNISKRAYKVGNENTMSEESAKWFFIIKNVLILEYSSTDEEEDYLLPNSTKEST